jgi:ribosomal protein S18 acetylase RimI-like enzyme
MASVTVRPMTPTEFQEWQQHSISSYAEDIAKATEGSTEAALERAHKVFSELLPDGLDTKGTWLLTVLDESDRDVGRLWVGPHPERVGVAYVYDIKIHEPQRHRGFGRAAMVAAEDLVRAAGIGEIGLNVFGFNEAARRLYDSLGYRVVATQMTKRLGTEKPAQQ